MIIQSFTYGQQVLLFVFLERQDMALVDGQLLCTIQAVLVHLVTSKLSHCDILLLDMVKLCQRGKM
jgi:hypothetical protein